MSSYPCTHRASILAAPISTMRDLKSVVICSSCSSRYYIATSNMKITWLVPVRVKGIKNSAFLNHHICICIRPCVWKVLCSTLPLSRFCCRITANTWIAWLINLTLPFETERINRSYRICCIPIQIKATEQANRISCRKLRSIGIIVSIAVIVKARFRVFILSRESQRVRYRLWSA